MTFKVGDRVKIVKDELNEYGGFVGSTGTIIRYSSNGQYQVKLDYQYVCNIWFSPGELRKI